MGSEEPEVPPVVPKANWDGTPFKPLLAEQVSRFQVYFLPRKNTKSKLVPMVPEINQCEGPQEPTKNILGETICKQTDHGIISEADTSDKNEDIEEYERNLEIEDLDEEERAEIKYTYSRKKRKRTYEDIITLADSKTLEKISNTADIDLKKIRRSSPEELEVHLKNVIRSTFNEKKKIEERRNEDIEERRISKEASEKVSSLEVLEELEATKEENGNVAKEFVATVEPKEEKSILGVLFKLKGELNPANQFTEKINIRGLKGKLYNIFKKNHIFEEIEERNNRFKQLFCYSEVEENSNSRPEPQKNPKNQFTNNLSKMKIEDLERNLTLKKSVTFEEEENVTQTVNPSEEINNSDCKNEETEEIYLKDTINRIQLIESADEEIKLVEEIIETENRRNAIEICHPKKKKKEELIHHETNEENEKSLIDTSESEEIEEKRNEENVKMNLNRSEEKRTLELLKTGEGRLFNKKKHQRRKQLISQEIYLIDHTYCKSEETLREESKSEEKGPQQQQKNPSFEEENVTRTVNPCEEIIEIEDDDLNDGNINCDEDEETEEIRLKNKQIELIELDEDIQIEEIKEKNKTVTVKAVISLIEEIQAERKKSNIGKENVTVEKEKENCFNYDEIIEIEDDEENVNELEEIVVTIIHGENNEQNFHWADVEVEEAEEDREIEEKYKCQCTHH